MDISDIEAALRRPLPGKEAQFLMAPGYRPDYTAEEVMKFNPRIGGVLLLINPTPERYTVVFTLRKEYNGTHSGQMSFPGGKREEGDMDITYTALRETEEEIGVKRETVNVIGALSELYIPPSNFLVYPTVGVLRGPANFTPQEYEVAEIVEIPLDFFMKEESRSTTRIKVMGKTEVEVPAYLYDKYVIWGATAIMMSEFVYVINNNDIAHKWPGSR
ncbi:MAG: CoA pyrophosphatase [Bacteroidetes bacterium]|nr:CoA pyrophosphatase [Bacteroidota bacterium]